MPIPIFQSASENFPATPVVAEESAFVRMQSIILRHFPESWPAVDLGLATCATLLLNDNQNPVAVIFVGPPSSGKSTVLEMFGDAQVNGETFCYVSDSFTPASFVSQAANRETDQLAQIDLLPRIRHKVLVTPELAPIFRGREDDLVQTFSILTRILDGQGYQRDSGSHGQRGYRGDYLFSWLGGTTPFGERVWKVMSQLGSRLFFLLMDHQQEVTIEDLISPTSSIPYARRLAECRDSVHAFLPNLFQHYGGVRGVEWNNQGDDSPLRQWIAQCAKLLAKMRSEPLCEDSPGCEEVPYRAYAVLYSLARGHALVHGRTQLAWEDLSLIAQVTISTMPYRLAALFRALVGHSEGKLTRAEVQDLFRWASHNTSQRAMMDVGNCGVIRYQAEGQGGTSYLEFDPAWAWCRSDDFRAILSGSPNLSINGGCV